MSQYNSSNEPMSPLRFHQIHGPDIQLFNNNTTARKVANGSSLLFSSHPLKPCQKFSLRLSEISTSTKEILTVGFTPYHPSENPQPTYSIKISCLKKNKRIRDKTVYFYYTPNGLFHFGVDGKDKGYRDGRMHPREPLWAFVYISNPVTAIEVLNFLPFDWSKLNPTAMTLHPSRGRNVKLINNVIYKYDRRLNTSYAFTVNPVKMGEHVIVRILDVDARSAARLILGLTNTNPSFLEKELPDDVATFLTRSEYWIVIQDPSWKFKLHDKISFVITGDGRMRVWRNESTLLKELRVNATADLWAFFEIADLESVEVSSYVSPNSGLHLQQDWTEMKTEMIPKKKPVVSEDGSCVVCYENAAEAALYPCGHMCMCHRCAKEQWRGVGQGSCPMCRVKIKDVLKIYKI